MNQDVANPFSNTPDPVGQPFVGELLRGDDLGAPGGEDARTDAAYAQVWERAVRVQASLATRLRLSPQSRLDPKTTARAFRNSQSGISASDYLAALVDEADDD